MKKFTLILASFLFIAGLANAQIMDGSFEAGPGGGAWIEASLNFGTPLCDLATCGNCGGPCVPNTGSIYAWFGGATAIEIASVAQAATFPTGTTASVDMMVKIPLAGTGTAADKLEVSVDATIVQTLTALDSAAYQAYTLLSVDVSSYADGSTHTLKIEGFQSSTTIFNVVIDDVSLVVDGVTTDVLENFMEPTAINVFPNPASEMINMSFRNTQGDVLVSIYSMSGELVSQEQLSNVMNKTFSFGTESMNNGVYLVEVQSADQITKERIVIAK